jgi:predicted DNA binding protein
MDLRAYYQKIRRIETGIKEATTVIVSRETPDGGKPGVKADVPRGLAARLIAEEKAELASPEEAAQFRSEIEAAWKAAQEAEGLTEREVRALRNALKPQRKL